ncbi:hypothetical protein CD006_26900 [Enterobacter sp. 10-1]|uniref:hypothetical protein n=1 Tax=Raoultella sp. 10-1 TaxID=2683201 RepID=UPI000BA2C78E|nr:MULTISPECIES: hypothetical protein [Enterobacteriaceae]MVT06155.1 hypothetical protein [Raoultella sp. 10-1]PAC07408.1 hypothetical protein CD006_26900 [Enterobacter sp. 10-1]
MSKIAISQSYYADLSSGYGYDFSGTAVELVAGDYVTLTITTEDGTIMLTETLRPSAGSTVLSWEYSETSNVKPHSGKAKLFGQDGAEKASDTALFTQI